MAASYKIARLEEIPSPIPPEPDSYRWMPIRHHLGIRAFGVNAGVAAEAGDWVVEPHTEVQEGTLGHEELYLVVHGRARFSIDGEDVDAPAGTLVFVAEPTAFRSAKAEEAGTTVLCIGARRGEAFRISPWERKYFAD